MAPFGKVKNKVSDTVTFGNSHATVVAVYREGKVNACI